MKDDSFKTYIEQKLNAAKMEVTKMEAVLELINAERNDRRLVTLMMEFETWKENGGTVLPMRRSSLTPGEKRRLSELSSAELDDLNEFIRENGRLPAWADLEEEDFPF